MNEIFDLTIRGGTIADDTRVFEADIGVIDGLIAAVGPNLAAGRRDIDARGRLVLPGGIDTHCHVEQRSGMGMMCADDWYSASVSAAFGGTTMIVPFAAQHRGMSLKQVAHDYAALAAEKSVIDYSYHLILSETDATTLDTDLVELIRSGITSFKVYMTYDQLKLDDYQLLDVLAVAAREQALVMVHAENNDVIRWVSQRLLERGKVAPKHHGVSHVVLAEAEATNRAIALSSLLDVPILIVHVSAREAIGTIAAARQMGAAVYGETCPHYLTLTEDAMDAPGMEGAKYCCSPPLRDADAQEALWAALKEGVLQTVSSDHAPYRFDASGKLPFGDATTFKQMANGMPGLELRLPLLFSEGVAKGRLTLPEFVALSATNHARMFGLYPRKGHLAVGADADIAIWHAERETTLTSAALHDRVGYTPYEGMTITGWPETVINAGRVIVEAGALHAERGSGRFIARTAPLPCTAPRPLSPRGRFFRALADDAAARTPAARTPEARMPEYGAGYPESKPHPAELHVYPEAPLE
ncbi:dihydropyrimidinase [Robbsia sp. Bb-Pol-6]|uniref:Dihydropyrimidinase n=1 Tax=Robbsia betulipollinis TaxID=2981849 RepID=A0ABT3ZTV7_9BURK|nr:dihydropyrimidinase [Robbsia betulipollinis]MCY0389345.1 dihydropyrimidinase [Robbsia betulipollinis]